MVYGVVALGFVVPLEQREVDDPQRSEFLRVAQAQLLSDLQTQGAELREGLEFLAAEDQHQVAGFCARAFGHRPHLLGRVELIDGRLDVAVRFDADPDESLGTDLLAFDELREGVDLFAGVAGAARRGEAGDVLRVVENREAVTLGQVRQVGELHAEAQVGFVRAVFLHRFDPGHAAQRLRKFDAHHFAEHVLGPALEDFEHVLLLDERHFAVDLREFGLAVGPQVFVAETAHDLEVFVVAGDHQQLLEGLGRLGQGVELVGAHAARHDEVPGAFGRGIDQVGGFDLQETFVAQEAADLLGHLVTQDHVALQGRTAQVEVAVFHTQVVAAVRVLLDGEWGHFGLVQHHELRGDDFDVARRHLWVLGRTLHHAAFDLKDVFAAQSAGHGLDIGRRVLFDDDLGDAVTVPQVDEGHRAEVADFLYPAGQRDRFVYICGTQLAAGMGSVHGRICIFRYCRFAIHKGSENGVESNNPAWRVSPGVIYCLQR